MNLLKMKSSNSNSWVMNKFIFIFITCAFLYGQNCWSQTQIDSSKIVKILSFNILHGKTMKGDFDLDVIAKVINDANADFVALQEVDFKTNRAKKYDLVILHLKKGEFNNIPKYSDFIKEIKSKGFLRLLSLSKNII